MRRLAEITKILTDLRAELQREFGVVSIGVFGSYVRGEEAGASDLDILVEFERPVGFFKFLEMEERLQDLLGVRVDLVSKKALKPAIGKRILEEVVYV